MIITYEQFYFPQYLQIVQIDEDILNNKNLCHTNNINLSKLLFIQKKKIIKFKRSKIKIYRRINLNNYYPLYFLLLNKITPIYYLESNNSNIMNLNFLKNFNKFLHLKLKKKNNKKVGELNFFNFEEKRVSFRNTFLNYWYEFFYNFFYVKELKPIKNSTINIKKSYTSKKLTYFFLNDWAFILGWLCIDLDNVAPLLYISVNFYFNKFIWFRLEKFKISKKLIWSYNFRKFLFKNNDLYKLFFLNKKLLFGVYFKRKVYKPMNVFAWKIQQNSSILKKKLINAYTNLLERVYYKVEYSLKHDNPLYKVLLVKKWYFSKRSKSNFWKTKSTKYIIAKEKYYINRKPLQIQTNIAEYVDFYSDLYSYVTDEFLKVNKSFFYQSTSFPIYKLNNRRVLFDIFDFNSNFFKRDVDNDFNSAFYLIKFLKKKYTCLYLSNPIKGESVYYFDFLKKSKKISNLIYFVKFKMLDKKKNSKEFFPVILKKNKFLVLKNKIYNIFEFFKKNKFNILNSYSNKMFEKYFILFYFTPLWSLFNDFRFDKFKKILKDFLKLINFNENFFKSNIFMDPSYQNFKSYKDNLIVKKKHVLKLSKSVELFLINYLEDFMQRNVCLYTTINSNASQIIKSNFLENLYKKLYNMQLFFGKNFFLKEMIEIFLWFFKFKDLNLFENWFLKAMHKLAPKKHRKFLLFLKSCICTYFKPLFKVSGLKGFYLRISGKISVTGNAKTRSQYIKWGEFSTSKKDNRLDLAQNIVRTNTGALGVTIMICY